MTVGVLALAGAAASSEERDVATAGDSPGDLTGTGLLIGAGAGDSFSATTVRFGAAGGASPPPRVITTTSTTPSMTTARPPTPSAA